MNLVTMTMSLGGAVLCESSLSFLGMGINPPTATWGSMVSSGYAKMATYPLLAIAPGIAIMILVLCFSIIGDAVRDALDPKLRGTIGVSKRKRLINKVKEMASADHAAEILAEGSDSNG